MALDERTDDGDPLKFLIKSNDPARDELKILCQAEDEDSKRKWIGILKKQLQTQMDFLRALQAPIAYHNRQSAMAKDYRDPWDVSPDQPPPISPTSRPARTISNINPPNNKSSVLDNALPCSRGESLPTMVGGRGGRGTSRSRPQGE